jgi:hypothetical protein
MGLDVAVYRHISRFSDRERLEVDPDTGEVLSRSAAHSLSPSAVAIERRLGNVDEIRQLRTVVQALLNRPDSIIESRVLYSGSHSGDLIGPELFVQLGDELALLQKAGDVRIGTFLESLTEVLATARDEGNPIVFL